VAGIKRLRAAVMPAPSLRPLRCQRSGRSSESWLRVLPLPCELDVVKRRSKILNGHSQLT